MGAAVSFGLHLVVAVWARPDYQDVADRAVDFEVAEITPGPPSSALSDKTKEPPPIQGPPAPPPPKEPKPEPPESQSSGGAVVEKTEPDTVTDSDLRPDTAVSAGSTETDSSVDTDSETAGGGTGICLHDLFDFAPSKPNWMLWVSMASLRGTVFEKDVARTLGSYGITRKLERVTGLDPAGDVSSVLVTAEEILNWKTYFVAASHDVAESRLKKTIAASYSGTSFSWRPTAGGWQAVSPDGFRYHLVASGRALMVEALEEKQVRADRDAQKTGAHATEPQIADNDSDPDTSGTDTKTRETEPSRPATDTVADGESEPLVGSDSGSADGSRFPPGAYPDWPRQIRCLVKSQPAEAQPASSGEDTLAFAKGSLRPDDAGHWPVAFLYTSDPRALGLPPDRARSLGFRRVSVRGFFSQHKVRIWGRVYLDSPPEQIERLAAGWSRLAELSRSDPFVKMVGLSGVIDNLSVRAEPGSVAFTVELTPAQTRAGLLFLQMQGEALGRRLSSP